MLRYLNSVLKEYTDNLGATAATKAADHILKVSD